MQAAACLLSSVVAHCQLRYLPHAKGSLAKLNGRSKRRVLDDCRRPNNSGPPPVGGYGRLPWGVAILGFGVMGPISANCALEAAWLRSNRCRPEGSAWREEGTQGRELLRVAEGDDRTPCLQNGVCWRVVAVGVF
jgi:hypothetical protein